MQIKVGHACKHLSVGTGKSGEDEHLMIDRHNKDSCQQTGIFGQFVGGSMYQLCKVMGLSAGHTFVKFTQHDVTKKLKELTNLKKILNL